jgi:hypothetical protein
MHRRRRHSRRSRPWNPGWNFWFRFAIAGVLVTGFLFAGFVTRP